METFIGVYDNVLSRQQCERCIELFESSSQIQGCAYNNDQSVINTDVKKDIELEYSSLDDGTEISSYIVDALDKTLTQYYETYSVGLTNISRWKPEPGYNFQKYVDDTDGFKIWHCENSSIDSGIRVLAWMIYFNDAQSGTDFLYLPNVESKQGRVVIWPAGWTHTHKSTPNVGLKYLATGWISYY